MRFKKTATKNFVASDTTTRVAAPGELSEESFEITLDQFSHHVFKDFVTRYQVNYLQ